MVGLFSCVYTQVALQCLQVTEACSTDLTWIWLLTSVDQHVGTQMSNLKREQKTKEDLLSGNEKLSIRAIRAYTIKRENV